MTDTHTHSHISTAIAALTSISNEMDMNKMVKKRLAK